MHYQRVVWHHGLADEPVVLWSEVGDDGYERRKVDEYRDGRLDRADTTTSTGTTVLGDQRVPLLHEIDEGDESPRSRSRRRSSSRSGSALLNPDSRV